MQSRGRKDFPKVRTSGEYSAVLGKSFLRVRKAADITQFNSQLDGFEIWARFACQYQRQDSHSALRSGTCLSP